MDSNLDWIRSGTDSPLQKSVLLFHVAILQNGLPVLLLVKTCFELQRCRASSKMTDFKVAAESFINSFN